ncbi:g12673 [Coccomyxa viridis]|uniref:G12673 protein n=1 Tax=Coccomyxa viridis TaxID=1274662 RepID=A0ABP1GB87_9CHLO
MLRLATQRAELARGRAQRAHAVFQKREEPTRVSIYSAEDGPISATCSQSNQHAPLQGDAVGAPAIGHQPTSASPAAREKHMPAAHAQPQDCTGTGHCAGQGLHLVGSLGHHQQAQANQDPLYSVDLSATPQLHLPSTAEPAGEALHRSSGAEGRTQQLAQDPVRPGLSPATPAQLSQSFGCRRSTISSDKCSETFIEISTTAAAKHPLSSRGTPKHHAEASPLSLEENLHPNLPMRPPQAEAGRLASCLRASSSHAPLPLVPESLHCIGGSMRGDEPSARSQQLPSCCEAPEQPQAMALSLCVKEDAHPNILKVPSQDVTEEAAPRPRVFAHHAMAPPSSTSTLAAAKTTSALLSLRESPLSHAVAPPQGSKDNPHPLPSKGKPVRRPDWKKASPEKAHLWLMYKKVLYRGQGGGSADFQTMSSEVPKEIIKKRRPEFGKRSDLQITTKLEDDITIPWRARVGKHQRDKICLSEVPRAAQPARARGSCFPPGRIPAV